MNNNASFSDEILNKKTSSQLGTKTAKTADIIEFKRNITQFELTKTIYESEIFSKIKMTASAKLFLWALCTHFNPNNKDMFPAQSTVAKKLGMSVKSAERAVKELKELGLISWTTKKVNHYNFSEKFFEMVKMSVKYRQNVGSNDRQNVGLTNKYEQKNNIKNFSSSKNGPWTLADKSGKKAVASSEETQEYFKMMEEAAKKAVNPWEYSKEEAENWLKTVGTVWLPKSGLARFLVKKYELVEYYDLIFGKPLANLIKKRGAEFVASLEDDVRESLEREEYKLIQQEQITRLKSCTDF